MPNGTSGGAAEALAPTLTQKTIAHASWIDFLPFVAMRDALIRHEFEFDHSDFIRDLVGDLINLRVFSGPPLVVTEVSSSAVRGGVCEDEGGLIVWGSPFLAESWEVTPWFWAFRGCDELLRATNRWRSMRGKRPLRFAQSTT